MEMLKFIISIDHVCLNFLILLFQQLSDKNIATIVEMGFSIQQATAALQHSAGSLDVALNSLLPSDQQNASTNDQPAPSGRESRTTASGVTSNGPAHRTDRADTRAHHQAPDSSHSDRTGMQCCLTTNCIENMTG